MDDAPAALLLSAAGLLALLGFTEVPLPWLVGGTLLLGPFAFLFLAPRGRPRRA